MPLSQGRITAKAPVSGRFRSEFVKLEFTLPLVFVTLIWAAYILWTVQTFWRTTEDAARAQNYAEAKFFGLFGTSAVALCLPMVLALPLFSYWQAVIFWALVGFPTMLWGGYFCSRWFHWIIGR